MRILAESVSFVNIAGLPFIANCVMLGAGRSLMEDGMRLFPELFAWMLENPLGVMIITLLLLVVTLLLARHAHIVLSWQNEERSATAGEIVRACALAIIAGLLAFFSFVTLCVAVAQRVFQ